MQTTTPRPLADDALAPLREQLLAAAREFTDAQHPLSQLLGAIADDVERAMAEPLEIFPICHHSPASALQMIRRLQSDPPQVIFMEMCEDFLPLVEKFADCKLPVAFQAFAGQTDAFPASWTPLSVVGPFTEFSAEYQAIVYTLTHPTTTLVFVDRSTDHLFQWLPQEEGELEKHLAHEETESDTTLTEEGEEQTTPTHGAAVGVQIGSVEPTFAQFREFLLRNAQVRHFAEWWDQYVEQPLIGHDYTTYRQVMCLVGSLLRRLGRQEADHASDRQRERFMWTRIKDYLAQHNIAPEQALYVCGAIHAVSDIPEYGTGNDFRWEIPPRTDTKWLYGMIPSSYVAIEHQFHFPPGTVTLADATWQKSRTALNVKPFVLNPSPSKNTPATKGKKKTPPLPPLPVASSTPVNHSVVGLSLADFLSRPPQPTVQDEEQFLGWCVEIVKLARKNGYLTSTADAIAIYQTSTLLGRLRNRQHPSPYDFRDAAITCLEKDRTPKKRNIERLCDILLGGDRSGRVGYQSLPPLAQDVYNRLAPLGVNLQASTIQRALLDLRKQPELLPCSDLLWKLRYLLQDQTFRPIMGERTLGHTPMQESWDIALGKNQTGVIMLGYEGITVEYVLEKRLKARTFAGDASTVTALAAVEDCLLYLKSSRLAEEMGDHAVGLLVQETGAQSAPEIFERVRRLVHHLRSTPGGLPTWLKRFVTTGYAHYCTLLPNSFADRGTNPEQIAGMLAFLFTLESLALSFGCNRSQLLIAVQQASSGMEDPNKLGLLWTAEWILNLRTLASIRAFFQELLDNPLALPAFPGYINGFLLALKFTPQVGRFVVELVSRAFERLPDRILMPWFPGLIMALRPHVESLLPQLLREVSQCYPERLEALQAWTPPWERLPREAAKTSTTPTPASPAETEVAALLRTWPAATEAAARLCGVEGRWEAIEPTGGEVLPSRQEGEVIQLLATYPTSGVALARLLGQSP